MITPRTAFAVLLLTKSCTCQSTSVDAQTAVASTSQSVSSTQGAAPLSLAPAANATCGDCYVNAATSSSTFQDTTDIILTAFSTTSAYMTDGVCITTEGVATTLSEPYTVTSPATIPSYAFQAYVISEFIDFLGFYTCEGSGVEIVPTPITLVTEISPTAGPSASLQVGANSTTSQPLHPSSATKSIVTPRLDEPSKIGIGAGVSAAAVILIFLAAFIWRKRRLRSAAITAGKQGDTENKQEAASEGDNQPYLQQKAELEAEERRKYELEGRQKMHELDGGTEIREIPAGKHEHRIAVMRSRQELTGGEHSQELHA